MPRPPGVSRDRGADGADGHHHQPPGAPGEPPRCAEAGAGRLTAAEPGPGQTGLRGRGLRGLGRCAGAAQGLSGRPGEPAAPRPGAGVGSAAAVGSLFPQRAWGIRLLGGGGLFWPGNRRLAVARSRFPHLEHLFFSLRRRCARATPCQRLKTYLNVACLLLVVLMAFAFRFGKGKTQIKRRT